MHEAWVPSGAKAIIILESGWEAAIDAPVTEERITVHLGPQPPVELIAALLEGTHLNYAILGGTGPR
jgi:hypothetical protein